MKAKWCMTCEKIILARYKRCPECGSNTIQDAEQLIKRLQERGQRQ